MIEKMQAVCIVSSLSNKQKMLLGLRDLGIVHIKQQNKPAEEFAQRFVSLSSVYSTLLELKDPKHNSDEEGKKVLNDREFEAFNEKVINALEEKRTYSEEASKLRSQIERLSVWGSFSPKDIEKLREDGVDLHFYKIGKKELIKLSKDENVFFIRLQPVEKMEVVAVIGTILSKEYSATEFVIPQKGLTELQEELYACQAKLEQTRSFLTEAVRFIDSYKEQILKCSNEMELNSVDRTFVSDEELILLNGYIPVSEVENFKSFAKKNRLAYILSDIEDDDEFVPTKIKYGKVSKLMKPVFGILGTVPGYREYDISFWFFCFFSLFFAMIIGDAGYGLCFLAFAVLLNVKQKKLSELTLLVYVVAVTTVIWGALTGTWFGLENAMKIPLLKKAVVPSLANYPQYFGLDNVQQQNNMMKFCFIIGTVQLSLACIMNIRRKLNEKNLSFVADIGWLLSVNSIYYVVLFLVIGETAPLKVCASVIVIGFLLVCLFARMAPGLSFSKGIKASLADSFTVFLNTISAFGNIMSYIRLFAVGLASLAIAQSFNDMALGMNGYLKVFGILIFVIGHVLNIVMGLLSVIVHGVRLNLLEFSGQLGMEWSGTEYNPFRMKTK